MEICGVVVVDVVTPYRSSTITDDDMSLLIQILCGSLSVWFESRQAAVTDNARTIQFNTLII